MSWARVGEALAGLGAVPARRLITLKLKRTERKEGDRCVTSTKKNRHKPKCAALVSIHGTLVRTGKTGSNSFVWNGKIGGHKLAAGTYHLTAILAGGASETVTSRS